MADALLTVAWAEADWTPLAALRSLELSAQELGASDWAFV